MWDKAIDVIRRGSRFVLLTHVSPEGDAVGSEMALLLALESMGKQVAAINSDPVPRIYQFLDPKSRLETYDASRHDPVIAEADAIIAVDVAGWERVGRVADAIKHSSARMLCIDHHASNGGFGDVDIIDGEASAAGELIFDLLLHLNVRITPEMATDLHVAVGTDTGWFRHANTTTKAMAVCARLIEFGSKPPFIFEKVYEELTWERTRLVQMSLARLKSAAGGRIAYAGITRDVFKESGAADEETEGIVDIIRTIKGVEVIILARETADGKVKVSLRAKGDTDVGRIAVELGGGGHRRAAGFTSTKSLDATLAATLAAAEKILGE